MHVCKRVKIRIIYVNILTIQNVLFDVHLQKIKFQIEHILNLFYKTVILIPLINYNLMSYLFI